jgi:hypothetical protein
VTRARVQFKSLAGYLFAVAVAPYNQFLVPMCQMGVSGYQYCRNAGSLEGSFVEGVKRQERAWFDVHYGSVRENAPISMAAMASERLLRGATITRAQPLVGTGADASIVRRLVGMRGAVQLGIENGENSTLVGDTALLFCNSVDLDQTPGQFVSQCYGDGWAAALTYTLTSSSKANLDELQAVVRQALEDKKFDYRVYQMTMYPIFIYAFLVLSGSVWLTRKAVRFVKGVVAESSWVIGHEEGCGGA